MMRLATLALLLALLPAGPAAAQELGRLFFTPEQRAALDARRAARLPDKPAAVAESPTTRVDGYVKRSSGKSTVWVDGEAMPDGLQLEGLRVQRGNDPTRVTVTIGEDGRRIVLRVGETLDRATGEVKDVLGDGEVRIGRGGAQGRR
jgi:hypothetical protein